MIKALIYKDATIRILRIACILALCWVAIVYVVTRLPISLDFSGTNPLNAESSVALASQALVIVAAVLANIDINSGEPAIAALVAGSRCRTAAALMTAKIVIILVFGLLLTMVGTIGNAIVYERGSTGRLVFQYMALATLNGVAALSLSLLAGNVLLGLSVYFLVPILLKPFIVYLAPATSGLFYSTAIHAMVHGTTPLPNLSVLFGWLFTFLLAGYLSIVMRILDR